MDSVALFRELSAGQSELIRDIFNWTEKEYFNHQLFEYESFLNRLYYGHPVSSLNRIKYSPIFAGFWKSEWVRRTSENILPFAEDLLAEGMSVSSSGELEVTQPTETSYDTIHDEYLFIHSHRRLIMDEGFMQRYYYTLKMIKNDD